jgi:hypothetical protein
MPNSNNQEKWATPSLPMAGIAFIIVGAIFFNCCYSIGNANEAIHIYSSQKSNAATYLPHFDWAQHNVGKLHAAVTNRGEVASWNGIDRIPGSEYPIHSNIDYIRTCGLWIGGIVGRDTLVSVGDYPSWTHEFNPDSGIAGAIEYVSAIVTNPNYDRSGISDQDFIARYTDTIITGPEDPFDNRPHKPLNLDVTQSSYAWGIGYTEDFVLVHYTVHNIGDEDIDRMFIGLPAQASVYHPARVEQYECNDISGFIKTTRDQANVCIDEDTLNLMWFADNDGGPNEQGEYDFASPTAVAAIQLIDYPDECKRVNFNWWTYLYGWIYNYQFAPRLAPTEDDPYREIGPDMTYPEGDRNKYYVLSHPEVDYDQMWTSINHAGEGFLPPPSLTVGWDIADGSMTINLMSFGPIDLAAGDSTEFTIAIVMGDHFHTDPGAYDNCFNALVPTAYEEHLDFSDLIQNARFAKWVYDNPGYDTDNNGYAGEFCWQKTWRDTTDNGIDDSVAVDSFKYYYTGDGIPDWRPMSPPPPPVIQVIPEHGKITIRWNGQVTETVKDNLSGEVDFEGYRVYMSEGRRLSDFIMLRTYDIDDYIVYEYIPGKRRWEIYSRSAKTDSLLAVYGQDFDPDEYYDEQHYFLDYYSDRIFFFRKQDWNHSDVNDPLGIHKVYPNADLNDPHDLTDEGWHRYFEYEYTIDNLEPSKPYYFAVTAFDYGSSQNNIGALETSPLANAVQEYPLPSSESVEAQGLGVMVYPNPYRIDAGYARAGYENRDRTRSVEWGRRIHFANLPKICTIRIYTLSGDLVREIKHYCPEGGPESQHEEWNVISRNTQAITTGIYLWSVRSEMGEQIGKLVIIK